MMVVIDKELEFWYNYGYRSRKGEGIMRAGGLPGSRHDDKPTPRSSSALQLNSITARNKE